ncbi:hypothetical protein F442_21504 [Phytophthora nicotianae P10297]|uniref:CLASP N-terminal domain-containing protein n=1 Tax=Phytophthora nicotianae P10297 TaxID=1317064 RepID=W2Y592_PHYNI|nr:hypothetical protein F442_21504 [Phytophthora nicotianae P10297]
MNDDRVPSRVGELVKNFVSFHDRVGYYLEVTDHRNNKISNYATWVTQLCAPTDDEIVALVEDAASVYTSPIFIRLLFRNDQFKDIRDSRIRLVDTLECQSSRDVIEELFKYLDNFTAEDRAKSFLFLASEASSEDKDIGREDLLDRIVESLDSSPKGLRPQLLLAASIIGHESMVTLLLRDIAADDLAPNMDTVDSECLIEAARNRHFSIVEKLLSSGRYSAGNETQWEAVVQALEVSCTNGSVAITRILLPHYLSYCSCHSQFLRLALINRHFEIVEVLLECDSRGKLCNMMELIDILREEVLKEALDQGEGTGAASSFESILVGKESDVVMWDAAALERGVSSGDTTLVRFLVNHVEFCRYTLDAALEMATMNENLPSVEIISTKIQKMLDREEVDDVEDDEVASYFEDEFAETSFDIDHQFQSCKSERSTANDDHLDSVKISDEPAVFEVLSNDIHPVIEDGLEMIRTTSITAVEHMISSARQSIALKKVGMNQNELVQVSSKGSAGVEIYSYSLDDTFPTAQTKLHQFSIKVVDEILSEGKMAATLPRADTNGDANDMTDFQVTSRDSMSMGSLNEHLSPILSAKQEQEDDAGQASLDHELDSNMDGVNVESLSSADDPNDTAEPAATDEDCCDHSDPIMTENASETEREDAYALELEDDEELLPTETSISDLQGAVGEKHEEALTIDEPPVAKLPTQDLCLTAASSQEIYSTNVWPIPCVEYPMNSSEISHSVVDTAFQLECEEIHCKEGRVDSEDGEEEVLSSASVEDHLANGTYSTASEDILVNDEPSQLKNEDTTSSAAGVCGSRNSLPDQKTLDDNVGNDLTDAVNDKETSLDPSVIKTQIRRSQVPETISQNAPEQGETQTTPNSFSCKLSSNSTDDTSTSQLSSVKQEQVDHVVEIENLPEIPSIIISTCSTELERFSLISGDKIRAATGASQCRSKERVASVISQHSRCQSANVYSSDEVAEWKNIDILLNRKRRFFQSQTGSIESIKVPWGEEFATIQSLKRFAAQHPDVLRAHIEDQLRELDGPLLSSSPRKQCSSRIKNSLAHASVGQAREALLLMKDLAFLLKQRLAPFFDSIIPVVMPFVFNTEKRFLCETAIEVLDAIILHCSGLKLALILLQLGETYCKYEDLRLYNLTSVYVEKCVLNWNKPELARLRTSQASSAVLPLMAKSLMSKSAPVRISAQKSFRHLRDELGTRSFEAVLKAHVPQDLLTLVQKECGSRVVGLSGKQNSSRRPEAQKQSDSSSPSILQRMLLHRQNRVSPSQT